MDDPALIYTRPHIVIGTLDDAIVWLTSDGPTRPVKGWSLVEVPADLVQLRKKVHGIMREYVAQLKTSEGA